MSDRPNDAASAGVRWETVERRVSHACEAFEVLTDRVRLPDGTETEYDHVAEPPTVVVLPLVAPDIDVDVDVDPLS